MAKKKSKKIKAANTTANAAKHIYDDRDNKFSWYDVRDKLLRYLGALIMEKDDDKQWVISSGRVSWWIAFLPAMYIFIEAFKSTTNVPDTVEMVSRDITPNHLTILSILAAYNFGKKAVNIVSNAIKDRKTEGPG